MGLFSKLGKKKEYTINSPVKGEAIAASEIEDETFASGMLGYTVGVRPSEGKVYAPADGTVSTLFETNHAIGITTSDGVELLIHVGVDTVSLKGEHFTPHTQEGASVRTGDLLLEFDIPAIQAAGYPVTTAVIVTNADTWGSITAQTGSVTNADCLLTVKK